MSARSSILILASCGTSAGTTTLTFLCSFVLVDFANELGIAPRLRAPSSLALTAAVFSRGHLLTLCSSWRFCSSRYCASFMKKRSPNFNDSVHLSSFFEPLLGLLLQHFSVLLISDPHVELDPVCQSFGFHHASMGSSSSDRHISFTVNFSFVTHEHSFATTESKYTFRQYSLVLVWIVRERAYAAGCAHCSVSRCDDCSL